MRADQTFEGGSGRTGGPEPLRLPAEHVEHAGGAGRPGSRRAGIVVNGLVLLLGTAFGALLTNGQIISWFRIQEMFRFDAFHMYGVIGSACLVGMVSMLVLRRLGARSMNGTPVVIERNTLTKGTVLGGLTFGIGWALTGACPGPLYALAGTGNSAYLLALVSAIAGALVYGLVKDRLPH